MGVVASAGGGVAEKVCAFIMLISSAFMQSISAFVAQNYGVGHMDRARRALHYGAAYIMPWFYAIYQAEDKRIDRILAFYLVFYYYSERTR